MKIRSCCVLCCSFASSRSLTGPWSVPPLPPTWPSQPQDLPLLVLSPALYFCASSVVAGSK
uniref:Uncharacterized protein n=1 Tax=Arundo donax TaxID=35708 RepID=A0A0A9G2X9_ARUDO